MQFWLIVASFGWQSKNKVLFLEICFAASVCYTSWDLSDEIGAEMAEIEVLLEEAAELVDESQLKNPNYYW